MMPNTVDVSDRDLRNLSLEFRTVSGRLLNTSFEEDLDNTERFLRFVEEQPIIKDFIHRNNTQHFDMESIVSKLSWRDRLDVPKDKAGEIAFVYQLLNYAVESKTPLYQIGSGYAHSTKFQDSEREFLRQVVHPFIVHINNYLATLVDDAVRSTNNVITVNVSGSGQANVALGGGRVEASNTTHQSAQGISEIIDRLVLMLQAEAAKNDQLREFGDLLRSIQAEVRAPEPRKSTIRVLANHLKGIASGIILTAATSDALERLFDSLSQFI